MRGPAAGRGERFSVRLFPAWFFLLLGVLPSLNFLAHADAFQPLAFWLGFLGALVVGGSASFARVVVNGPRLRVQAYVFGRRSVRLDRLASVDVKRKTGRKGRHTGGWWIILRDHDGRRVGLSLIRSRNKDQILRLAEVIRQYADETSSVVTGPDEWTG